MGTKRKKYLHTKGISANPTFFEGSNPFALFIIVGTLIFAYGYNRELYY